MKRSLIAGIVLACTVGCAAHSRPEGAEHWLASHRSGFEFCKPVEDDSFSLICRLPTLEVAAEEFVRCNIGGATSCKLRVMHPGATTEECNKNSYTLHRFLMWKGLKAFLNGDGPKPEDPIRAVEDVFRTTFPEYVCSGGRDKNPVYYLYRP